MSRSESRRLTFWIAVYCLAFTVVLCALYFLFVAVTAPWATHTGRLQTAYTASPVQVIVDAGHGGRDGGATGVTGLVEKNLNLEIATLLHDMLCAAGTKTCMTRTVDSLV